MLERAAQVHGSRRIRKSVANRGAVQLALFLFGKDEESCAPFPVRFIAVLRLGKRQSMRQITAEQFVGAVAGDGDLDVTRHRFRKEVGGDNTGKRLVERLENPADGGRIVRTRDRLFAVIGSKSLGRPPRPSSVLLLPVGGGAVFVGQREGLDTAAGGFGGKRRHQ